jgi:uncharacterized protein YbbC (DUF1343 family)
MPTILPGVEVLLDSQTALLKGLRVGLVTNHTGVTRRLESTVDQLVRHRDIQVTALFSGEHGLRGDVPAGVHVAGATDLATGLPSYSLYGDTRKPTPEMLRNVDALVFDMQDAGVRFYTYTWTMAYCMEAAAEHGLKMVVLDRPNPIGGAVEGGILHSGCESFVGLHPLATRHGLTMGEIARWLRPRIAPHCDLTVVPMTGWHRGLWYDETGLPFVPPSPNTNGMGMLTLYPGTCFLEGTNLSEGRGTAIPFQVFGAPWLEEQAVLAELRALDLPGVLFRPAYFTPTASKHAGLWCRGIQIHVTDRRRAEPVALGAHLLEICHRLHPHRFQWMTWGIGRWGIDLLTGSDRLRKVLNAGEPLADLLAEWDAEAKTFAAEAAPFHLYP